MFKLAVEGATLSDLKHNLAAVLAALDPTVAASAPRATKQKDDQPSDTAGSSGSASTGRTATKTASRSKPEPEADEDEDEPSLVYDDDVRPLVVALSKAHGREAALEVVSKFKDADDMPCESAKQVQAKDWPALVTAVKKAQKKLDAAKAAADED